MIPRRLCLKGFMCYGAEAEVCFSGSSIWALTGGNGEGKSAIFDAMRYALYGVHRMGKQNVEALIHRGMSSFVIEFDFAVGENEYRIRRTHSRSTRGTRVAMYLSGPNAPVTGRTGPQVISGTESDDSFKDWVLRTIGLDDKTFTVSVLLLQGQSDMLLKLGGAAKHDVLTQIIDLSRYESLCKLAGTKQKEQEQSVKNLTSQLGNLAEVDEEYVLNLEIRANGAKVSKEEARLRQLTLTKLKEQAKLWQKQQDDAHQLKKQVAAWNTLLEQAEYIESRATRLVCLQQVMPSLKRIHNQQNQCSNFNSQIEQDRKEVQEVSNALQDQSEKVRTTQQQLNELRKQRAEAEHEQKTLQPRLLLLNTTCAEITRLRGQEQKCEGLEQKIAKFASDLEQQQQHLQTNLAELKAVEEAFPRLKQFAQARGRWQEATRALVEAEQELSSWKGFLAETGKQKSLLQEQITAISERLSDWRSEVARKKTLLEECEKHMTRFQNIDGQPTCSYCGQDLTPAHLETERQRIEAELQETQKVYQAAHAAYTVLDHQKKMLTKDLERLSLQEESQQQAVKQCEAQYNTTRSTQEKANGQATTILHMFSSDYIARIQGITDVPVDLQTCLNAVYPTTQDLEMIGSQLQNKRSLENRLAAVANDMKRRAELVNTLNYMLGEIQPLRQKYPSDQATTLLEEQEQTLERNKYLLAHLKDLDVSLLQQSQQFQRLEEEKQCIEQKKGQIERNIDVTGAHLANSQQVIQEIYDTLPIEWQELVEDLSQPLLDSWMQETAALNGVAEQRQNLQSAQQNYARDQQALEQLNVEIEQIPDAARRPPTELELLIEQVNLVYQTFDKQEREANTEVQHLKNILARRQELEQQRAKSMHLASSYKDLARLLGRDGLQGFLVQKAEEGIVYHANEILDRISGGVLRLALRPSTDRRGGELDMVAYNTAISANEAQPILLLSGSQQFRVAVSLALGIGRYAGNENHRVESAIIDEGFGSLDKKGRSEMIYAIKALQNELKCIIVVSHQSEFFDEFPNRYFVELVNGSTQVSLN